MKNPESCRLGPSSRCNGSVNTLDIPQSRCRAAIGQIDITPPIGIYHRMWGAAKHDRAASVHRPLTGTMLWIVPRNDDKAQSSVIIALDHCILDSDDIVLIQAAVAAGLHIGPEQVNVCLSHTHAAGLMSRSRSSLPGGDMIGPYLDRMASELGKLARIISEHLVDATIVYGVGRCDLAAERDYWDADQGRFVCGFNPTGIADDTLVVGKVTDNLGVCLATIVNYACHPTTLAWDNQAISPDYVGAMREVIQSHTHAPCLFLQGASGDLGPRQGFVGDTAVADRNGRKLGFSVLATLETIPLAGSTYDYAGAVVSGTQIGTWKYSTVSEATEQSSELWKRSTVIAELPYRHDLASIEESRQQLAHWNELEEEATSNGDVAQRAYYRAMAEQMQRQIWRQAALPEGKCFPLHIQVLHCGAARWLFVPGEHYQVLQTELRKRFPREVWLVATICNGWQPGYVPPASKYGYGIYQEQIAIVAAGSAEIVIESLSRSVNAF
jgi:hypothetical protein